MFEIFNYEFIQRSFIAGILIAITAPMIGVFLVVKRYSLMADTLAHVSLLGVALGLILDISPFFTAIICSLLASLAIEKIRSSRGLYSESVLSLFLSGSLAVAIVLISLVNGFNTNLNNYLFGSISTVLREDLYVIFAISALTIFLIGFLYKKFFLLCFDEELALASGIKVGILNAVLIMLASLQVSMSIRIVGVLLIGALMVIPVITAMQFQKGFLKTMILAIAFSLASVIIGLFLSYYFDLASGGIIVLLNFLFFFFVYLWKKLTH